MNRKLLNFVRWRRARSCCFHFGRCGSTLLGNMLASHPTLDWQGELFHSFHERDDRQTKINGFEILRRKISDSKFRHFGFETKFQHLDENGLNVEFEVYVRRLRQMGFNSFIILSRRNYLRQAISVARGQSTGKWHVSKSAEKPERQKLTLDLNNVALGGRNRPLLDCFRFLDQTYSEASKTLQTLKARTLQIYYEDDLETESLVGYQKVISHLGLSFATAESTVQKLESRPISDVLRNYSALQKMLHGTKYEWMCTS